MAGRTLAAAAKWAVSCLLLGALYAPLQAQVIPRDSVERPDTLAADSTRRGITPRGAMFRSIVIPGWGQAAVGSYTRGGIFFAIRSSSYYMLFRTIGRLNESRDIERRLTRCSRGQFGRFAAPVRTRRGPRNHRPHPALPRTGCALLHLGPSANATVPCPSGALQSSLSHSDVRGPDKAQPRRNAMRTAVGNQRSTAA